MHLHTFEMLKERVKKRKERRAFLLSWPALSHFPYCKHFTSVPQRTFGGRAFWKDPVNNTRATTILILSETGATDPRGSDAVAGSCLMRTE